MTAHAGSPDASKENQARAGLDLQMCALKELELIQQTITRMASNSMLLKGWAVSLVVVALAIEGAGWRSALGFIPLLAFWGLDTFYLRTEKKYRKLHEWVARNRMGSADWLFSMDTQRFEQDIEGVWAIAFSRTLFWFYGGIAVLLVLFVLGSAILN